MAVQIIPLLSLIDNNDISEEDIQVLLNSFVSLRVNNNSEPHDVEVFLKQKAISFERMNISRTYLLMSSYRQKPVLVGYFSISNKPLIIAKKNFIRLSKTQQKRLLGFGNKTDQSNYQIPGYLIGQIGKNYSVDARACNTVTGKDIVDFALAKIVEGHRISGGRIVYLECENHQRLKRFYTDQGFKEITEFISSNGLVIMIQMLS